PTQDLPAPEIEVADEEIDMGLRRHHLGLRDRLEQYRVRFFSVSRNAARACWAELNCTLAPAWRIHTKQSSSNNQAHINRISSQGQSLSPALRVSEQTTREEEGIFLKAKEIGAWRSHPTPAAAVALPGG